MSLGTSRKTPVLRDLERKGEICVAGEPNMDQVESQQVSPRSLDWENQSQAMGEGKWSTQENVKELKSRLSTPMYGWVSPFLSKMGVS